MGSKSPSRVKGFGVWVMPVGLIPTDSTRVQGQGLGTALARFKVRVSIPRSPYSGLEDL